MHYNLKSNNQSLSSSQQHTCLKKLDTVRVTGGKESSRQPISAGAWPGPSMVLFAAPNVLDEAHDDRLSFRSREPFRVRDPPSPAGLEKSLTTIIFISCCRYIGDMG